MNQSAPSARSGAIAIIGLAGRFPGAADVAAFWDNLQNGVESVRQFSESELRAAGVSPELLALPGYVRARPVLADIELFDPEFFGYSPREAELMDPQQRLFLETAWQALEQAGYDAERVTGPVGVFGGAYLDTYLLAQLCAEPGRIGGLLTGLAPGAYHTYLGNDKDYLTSRVAYKLNLRGPAVTVQTACSTSLVAVCQACQSLLCCQCDLALAGGVTVIVPQTRGYLAQEGGMFSPDGHCRPFDAQAQGTPFGNGVGLVVLKRLEEALADGDHIHAVIKGSALNNDGAVKVSYTAPSVAGQAEVIALAQAIAGVSPESIQYIEAHGTGTPLGDPIEVAALTQAFRLGTTKTGFCGLGSVKSNFGHLDAAAGVVSLIKTALALQHRLIPPTLHFQAPNPKIDFANSPFYVVDKPIPWQTHNGTPRRAGVSSFGVGGTNAHVVLEEAPPARPLSPSRAWQLVVLSAKTAPALEQATANLTEHLAGPGTAAALPDIAYTLEAGRRAFAQRRFAVLPAAAPEPNAPVSIDPKSWISGATTRRDPPVVFLFPGQGAQQLNMGAELQQQEPVFREAFARCAALVPELDLRAALADKQRLVQTVVTQPALFATEYALAELWRSWGIRPAAMIGHSVGEYVAATLAGVFTPEQAMRLVAARARLVQAQPPGAMTAVRLAESQLQPMLGQELSVAAINAPGLCIVAGPLPAVAALEKRLKAAGHASVRLPTSHAFHSAMMDPVVAPFQALLEQTELRPPQIPYVSNVTGRWVSAAEATDPRYWAGHVRQAVRFAEGVSRFFADPSQVLLEIGPNSTLAGLARQHPDRPRDQAVIAGGADLPALLGARGRLWLAGVSLDPAAFFGGQRRQRVALPTYPFQRRRCWVEAPPLADAPPLALAAVPRPANGDNGATAPALSPTTGQHPTPVAERLLALLGQLSGRRFSAADQDTSFVELGFESLFLTQVTLALTQQFRVRVAFRELMGELNTIRRLAEYLEKQRPEDRGQRSEDRDQRSEPGFTSTSRPINSSTDLSLSEAQREVWLAAQLGAEASCAFNQSCVLHLRGALRRERLEQALAVLVARHEALRARFSALGESLSLAPAEDPDRHALSLESVEAAGLDELLAAEAGTPFDLERGPVWRARWVALGAEHHVLLLTVHHIVCDGRSLALLAHELGELYSGRALPAARSLGEYLGQQDTGSAGYQAARSYWLAQYANPPEPLELPTDQARPAEQTYRGALASRELSAELTRGLRQAGARQGCTLFGTLLAAYAVWLHRLSGQTEIVIGVPTAAPGAEQAQPLVGHTVNFLGLRLAVDGDARWSEHLARTKQLVVDAFEHRAFTYGTLLSQLRLNRDLSRLPLVSVSFNLAQARHPLRFAGLTAWTEPNPQAYTNQDLFFDFNEAEGRLTLECVYNRALFAPATIERWLGHFQTLLEAVVDQAEPVPVGDLPLLSAAERQQILVEWNNTAHEYPAVCVHELVEAQVRRTPARMAVQCGPDQLTYAELNQQADRLAAWLRGQGVGPDQLVGLQIERSLAMLVALVAVSKAGGAYLPLDPQFPAERLRYMIDDARPVLVLTRAQVEQVLAAPPAPTVPPGERACPEHLAYVLYTSGSTGKPKGVLVTQRALVNLLTSFQRAPGLDLSDVMLAVTTLSFDIAGVELWLPLICGARVILVARDTAADGAALRQALEQSAATVLQATPATWRLLLAAGWAGTPGLRLFSGGEDLPADLAAALLQRGAELWNLYGPTETTIYSTRSQVEPGAPVWLGRPLDNTTCYVLDRRRQPVPIGVAGELYIGGHGLARGYWQQPALTAEKFVPHPFVSGPERLYRTGDLVRQQPDGRLKYLGRLDHQVKIRGFRIELGEIESVLRAATAQAEAVVVAREDVPGDKRLVAYLKAADQQARWASAELREKLRAQLPEYMVPAAFVGLAQFPLTPNGKINRRALPPPDPTHLSTRLYTAPRTELEQQLAGIWTEVLRLDRVGLADDFFALGGHSLLATQVLARVRDLCGVQLPLRVFFAHPTLRELAAHVEALRWAQGTTTRVAGPLVEGEL